MGLLHIRCEELELSAGGFDQDVASQEELTEMALFRDKMQASLRVTLQV